MEKKFVKFTNKKNKNSKSVSERLVNIRLQIPSNSSVSKNDESKLEEYPKLRRPKPETLLKIQALQKKPDAMVIESTEDEKSHDFVVDKEQLEDQGNIILNENFRAGSDGAKPNTLNSKLYSQLARGLFNSKDNIKLEENGNEMLTNTLNYYEQQLINIFRTKVMAHPNGFFAENLPAWYKKTFGKDVPFNWLDLLRLSEQFEIENVNNKIVLYTKETNEFHTIDSNKTGNEKESKDSVGFVRYKHLQKSLIEYNKQTSRYNRNISKKQ